MAEEKDYAYRTGDNDIITDEFEEAEIPENENETPEEETPENETPEEETPENETPEEETPENETPEDESPENENETPEEETPEEPEEPEEPETPEEPALDFEAALKEADKWEVLNKLGFDDFTIGMLKYKEQTGDYTPYLEAKTVDYTKMTPEQVLRLKLKKENEGMSERAFNIKLRKEIEDKYYLDRETYPEDSDEAILGQEQLRLDGEAARKAFIENQKQFKAQEPLPDLDATRKEAEMQQLRASMGNSIMNDAATVSLKKAKTLTFGQGEASFRYPIKDVQPLIDAALTTIVDAGRKDLKGVDLNIFYKQLAYGSNPEAFEKAWADHITAIAKKKYQKGIQNVKPKSEKPHQPKEEENLTPAQQLAKYGKFS